MSQARDALRICTEALELHGDARDAFVQRECGKDVDLESEVTRLLAAAERAIELDFMDQPATANLKALGGAAEADLEAHRTLPTIDRYRLIEPLGEGGFGTVYLAEQLAPVQREVALKLIRSDRCDDSFVRRFEAERQVLALLDHPGIAQIFDAGATDAGDPYLVMERIHGEPITRYCDRRRLDLRHRIELFAKVCAALQHAHQKGVIHRDIKPANVLVAETDGEPIPKVIDFGIARAANLRIDEKTLQTEGGVLGSPLYMSPEQVDPNAGADIDTRADVYSLGVLLYELLTGATPFDAPRGSLLQVLRQILESDPPRPSERARSVAPDIAAQRGLSVDALVRQLDGDLDWIVLKALEKDRERRYDSAAALAADLRRYLTDEPVEARPPGIGYRTAKFVRRNRAVVAGAALLLATLLAGLVGTGIGFVKAREQAVRAQETVALLQEFLASPAPDVQGRDLTVVELLESFEPRLDALSERPAIQADLLHTYGATYLGLGLFDRAAEFAERAMDLRIELAGESHPRTLAAINQLGRIRLEQGQFADSAALQRTAVERAQATLGDNHLDTIAYTVGLAEALQKSGELEEAVALHRQALDQRRRLLGDNHDATLHSMNKLGETLVHLGEYEEAMAWSREAAHRRTEHFGPDHPETLHAMSNLSFNLGETGRYAEAAVLDREILERRIRVLGEEHRKTIVSMNNLAWVLDKLAEYDESIALNRRALAILERTLGPDSPDTLVTKANLAMALLNRGDLTTAEQMTREVIEGRTRVLGAEHPVTLVGVGNLVTILQQQARFEEAVALVRDLIERRTAVHGPEHHNTLVARSQLSGLLSDTGAYEEAERWARNTLAPRVALSGDEGAQTLAVKLNLAKALTGLGRLDDAERLAREVLALRSRDLGEDHPGTLSAMEAIADILARRGREGEAQPLLQRVLEQRTAQQGAGHPHTLRTRMRMATLAQASASQRGN